MADKFIRIAGIEDAIGYDDADFDCALETDAPIKAGAPVDPSDVLRKADEYTPGGSDTDITVVTAIQAGGGGAVGFQYKTRFLTINGGIVAVVGNESAWVDV